MENPEQMSAFSDGRKYDKAMAEIGSLYSAVFARPESGPVERVDETRFMLLESNMKTLERLRTIYFPLGDGIADASLDLARLAIQRLEGILGTKEVERVRDEYAQMVKSCEDSASRRS